MGEGEREQWCVCFSFVFLTQQVTTFKITLCPVVKTKRSYRRKRGDHSVRNWVNSMFPKQGSYPLL